MNNRRGFTLIELLIVISIIGIMLAVTLPVSFSMYSRYKASLKAQEIMVYISDLRRDAFLYSERKTLTSSDGALVSNGGVRNFEGAGIHIDKAIEFYKNGTTSGGVIRLNVGDHIFALTVKEPLGDLIFEAMGMQ